jgi:hypothetical protein
LFPPPWIPRARFGGNGARTSPAASETAPFVVLCFRQEVAPICFFLGHGVGLKLALLAHLEKQQEGSNLCDQGIKGASHVDGTIPVQVVCHFCLPKQ